MAERTSWKETKRNRSEAAQRACENEARISEFRDLVQRLRTEAGLTQAELAGRLATTQSAIARMEGGGTRPMLDTLGKLAGAGGQELVAGVVEHLGENRSIAKLEREGTLLCGRLTKRPSV